MTVEGTGAKRRIRSRTAPAPSPVDESAYTLTRADSDAYRQKLIVACEEYNPEMLPQVDDMLDKYSGKEEDLLRRCRDRYAVEKRADVKADESAREASLLRDIMAQCKESDQAAAQRQAAFNAILREFQAWTGDTSSQVLLSGSVALSVHLPGADTDLVCITSSPRAHNFFTSFAQHLKGVSEVEFVLPIRSAMPPLIQATVLGIKHDLLFCYVPVQGPLPPMINVSFEGWLHGMDTSSRRSLGGPRLANLVPHWVPNLRSFQIALQAVKLWAVRRGVTCAKYGYPAGVSWTAMTSVAARRSPPNASPLTIISTFFQLFQGVGLSYPISMTDVPQGWRKSVDDKMAVLVPVPTPPGAPPQMINTCSGSDCTVAALVSEMDRAALLCRTDKMQSVWNSADLFGSYPRLIQIEVGAINSALFEPWVAYVESRFRDLLKLLDNWALLSRGSNGVSAVELRPHPFMYRSDTPGDRLDYTKRSGTQLAGETGDFAAYIFIGVKTEATTLNADPATAACESEDLVNSLDEWTGNCGDWSDRVDGMFVPVVSVIEPRQVPAFVLDHPIPEAKATRQVDAALRNFVAHGGLEDAQYAHMKRLSRDTLMSSLWFEDADADTDTDAVELKEGDLVVVRALDGEGDRAWVRTEDGYEGFVKQAELLDFAVAAIPREPSDIPPSPMTPSAYFMKTKGDTKLRALPNVEPCVWVDDTVVPDGAIVAVLAMDDFGEFALVRYNKTEGFIRTKHLQADVKGKDQWVSSERAQELLTVVDEVRQSGGVRRVCGEGGAGTLRPLEHSLLEMQGARKGLVLETFADASYLYAPSRPAQRAANADAEAHADDGVPVVYCGVELASESSEVLRALFSAKGLLPATWTLQSKVVFLKTGPLNDPLTAGHELTLQVVSMGSCPQGIAAGVIGCSKLAAVASPHVVVATNTGAVDALETPYLKGLTWELLPDSEIVEIRGTVMEYTEAELVEDFLDEDEDILYSFDCATDPTT